MTAEADQTSERLQGFGNPPAYTEAATNAKGNKTNEALILGVLLQEECGWCLNWEISGSLNGRQRLGLEMYQFQVSVESVDVSRLRFKKWSRFYITTSLNEDLARQLPKGSIPPGSTTSATLPHLVLKESLRSIIRQIVGEDGTRHERDVAGPEQPRTAFATTQIHNNLSPMDTLMVTTMGKGLLV